MSAPPLRRKHTPVPRLEDTTADQRRTLADASLVRLRRGNAADVWQLTLRDHDGTVAAESLFTLPLAAAGREDATDRAGSFLAAVDLAPTSAWEQLHPALLRTTIHTPNSGPTRPDTPR